MQRGLGHGGREVRSPFGRLFTRLYVWREHLGEGIFHGVRWTRSPMSGALFRPTRCAPALRSWPGWSGGKIALKVINHYGDEVLKVYGT